GAAERRRKLLLRAAAEVLGCPEAEVAIEHSPGLAPRLAAPLATRLGLSCASRGVLAAAAAGSGRVGVDVELVEPAREPPWNVLHAAERAALDPLPPAERARLFARIWSAKEAYLKALGTGLARELSSFAALSEQNGALQIFDGALQARVATLDIREGGRDYAVAAVALA
ncbi:MAG: 4'-phosphopantetheinyl transferase superfamily protein, partial [Methylobacteriaceae bacterium]|nr:4'-phosphopantetheinyl transferase superfamily protein [Methylobacteriaceae bacterium]